MTGAQVLAAFRRAVIPALAAGLGLLVLVMLVLLTRPASYSARMGLVAAPTATTAEGNPVDYGAVVSMTMQALPELAVSDSTIDAIGEAVPEAPSATDLRNAITVELVPSSGVARITITAGDRDQATAMLDVLVAQIRKADLLAPVATLEPIGSTPTVQEVSRDPRLALGLGLIAGTLASLIAVVLVQALRPRLLTTPDVEQVVEQVFAHSEDVPPVVALDDSDQGLHLLAAHLLAQKPVANEVTVVPAGSPLREDLAVRLRNALRTLRVARDAGLPVGHPLLNTVVPRGEEVPEADRSNGTSHNQAAEVSSVGVVPTSGEAEQARRGQAPGAGTRLFAPMSPPASEPSAPSPRSNPLSHLVVTVRLGRTTPTELTTALVALRAHGTGVAGVAVG